MSLIPNAVGLFLGGLALDRGLPALYSNMALVTAATALAFPVFYGVGRSLAAAWCLVPLFQLFVGAVQVHSLLPCTRIYEPLSVSRRRAAQAWGWALHQDGGGSGVNPADRDCRRGDAATQPLQMSQQRCLFQPPASAHVCPNCSTTPKGNHPAA